MLCSDLYDWELLCYVLICIIMNCYASYVLIIIVKFIVIVYYELLCYVLIIMNCMIVVLVVIIAAMSNPDEYPHSNVDEDNEFNEDEDLMATQEAQHISRRGKRSTAKCLKTAKKIAAQIKLEITFNEKGQPSGENAIEFNRYLAQKTKDMVKIRYTYELTRYLYEFECELIMILIGFNAVIRVGRQCQKS